MKQEDANEHKSAGRHKLHYVFVGLGAAPELASYQRNKSVAESQDGCLPCPFCGDYPDVACDGDDPPAHYIQCLACYVSTYAYGDTKDEALSKWNTRVWTEEGK